MENEGLPFRIEQGTRALGANTHIGSTSEHKLQ